MDKEALATIVSKVKLTDNLYLFKYEYTTSGVYDEELDLFLDELGNEYIYISDLDLIFSDQEKGFVCPIALDELKKAFPEGENDDIETLKIMYDQAMKEKFYYVFAFENEDLEDFAEVILIEQNEQDLLLDIAKSVGVSGIEELGLLKITESDLKDVKTEEDIINLLNKLFGSEKNEQLVQLDSSSEIVDEVDEEKKEEKVNEKEEIIPLDINKLRNNIKKRLINQDEALKRLTTEIARMRLKNCEKNKGILLIGPTGSGKTYMMDLLAKELDVPFLKIDSTQLTIPGYVGKDIEEYLWDLYVSCGKNVKKAEQAIIFFDEIDKKGSGSKSDISGQGVLNVLLKFLDGTTYDASEDLQFPMRTVKINTSNMIVVAGGAFPEVLNDMKNNPIGFGSNNCENEKDNVPTLDDFTKKAFMPEEFMGRFPIIIKLNRLDEKGFEKILLESDDSTLKEEIDTFSKLGVRLIATPEYIQGISSNAIKLKTGVRGLMGCVENSTWEAFEDVLSNPEMYEEIILGKESINDSKGYQKVLKKEHKDT